MFKIAVCDDNKYDIKEICGALDQLKGEGINLQVTTYTNGRDIIADFEKGERFHLLILDMVMQPINGIETAKELRKNDISMPILIVTSTRDFALDGYLVNAWRYLTKPIDREKFLSEVRVILDKAREKDKEYFIVENDQGISKVKLDDVIYFESNLHVITLHTIKENYSFRDTISKIEETYAPDGFFRIHKSFLVNLKYVKNVSKLDVKMINGEILPLAKLRAASLHEALLDYVSRNTER